MTDAGWRPVGMVALGVALLCVLDVFVKMLAESQGPSMAVVLRYGGGALWGVLFFLVFRGRWPSRASLRQNFLRSMIVVVTAMSFFYALWRLPFAEAIALTFTSPIFMALLGRLILREHVRANVVLAIVLGFGGVLVILAGRLSGSGLDFAALDGVVAALVSAVAYAFAMVLLRKQTGRDPVLTIVALQNIFAFLILTPVGAVHLQMAVPSRQELLMALVGGLFGTVGHLAMAWGYARAEAARLGALEYTAFIWATLFGWAFFSETPSPLVFAGAVLIVAGAVVANSGRRAPATTMLEEGV